MEEKLIHEHYQEAVAGINKELLENYEQWYYYVLNLPEKLQVVYTIVLFHQQVFNGGVHQYFFNSYGQFCFLTVQNLKKIKAFDTAKILEIAISYINSKGLLEDDFRKKIYTRTMKPIVDFEEPLFEKLDNLDDEYYDSEEDLTRLVYDFLKNTA